MIVKSATISELKTLVKKKKIPVRSRETFNAIELLLTEDDFVWECIVYKENDERYDAGLTAEYLAAAPDMRLNDPIELRAADGRRVMQPTTMDEGLIYLATSLSDTDTGVADGHATRVYMNPGDPNVILSSSYRDWVEIIVSTTTYAGAELTETDGDWISYRIEVPERGVTVNTSSAGNAMALWGIAIAMPAPVGSHDVDLYNANFMRSPDRTGFWNWSWPTTGRGVLSPAPNGDGEFHVVAGGTMVQEFVRQVYLLGSGEKIFQPPNPKPATVFPGWKFVGEAHKAADGTTPLMIVANTAVGRKSLF